jgi:TorA maturation chaperone TorD
MDAMKQELKNRTAVYALVSRLMIKEGDEAFLDTIEHNETFASYFPHLATWKKKEEYDRKDLIERYYNVDYANLFIMHLVPYETFYTRDDQMIESGFGNPVAELYDALGFTVELEKARVISVDHIGVELEFMYKLVEAQLAALEAGDKEGVCELFQIQKGFLKDHLLEWAPMFLINVKREARTPLYHDGAELTLEFLLSDYEYVNEKLQNYCGDIA